MPRNVEIKARVASLSALEPAVAALATAGPQEILQDDTFFSGASGRLKLRAFSAASGELIHYQRSDHSGPKESAYVLTVTADPAGLREALTRAYGQAGRVSKRRTLYLVGRTRVHLDWVDGLGEFMELEVVLADGEPAESGSEEAQRLMAQLGIAPAQLIEGAYLDLLAALALDSAAA